MADRMESLDALLAEVETQRQDGLRHFESLDTKAGVMLGFAGLLVAVAPAPSLVASFGTGLAVATALSALWTFLPRDYPALDMGELRNQYLHSRHEFMKLHLFDTKIALEEQAASLLERKTKRLRLTMFLLATAVVTLAGGILSQGGANL